LPGPAQAPKTSAPPDHQQGAAVQGMVERLADRLKKSGSDPQGWLMLTRSYLTLGEKDKATAAINEGRRALADDPAKLAQFNEALKSFKIDE
jgi:cytochrome c-type biogenesis protein CcmH